MLHSWNCTYFANSTSHQQSSKFYPLALKVLLIEICRSSFSTRHYHENSTPKSRSLALLRCVSNVYESLTFSSPFLSSFLAPISWFRPQSDIFWGGVKHKKEVTSTQRMVFTLTDLVQDTDTWNVSFPHIFARPCHPKSDSLWHLPRLTLATIICLRRHRPILLIPSFLLFKAKEATHTLELWMGKNCTRSHSKVTREASILFSNLDDSKPSK